MNVESSDAHLVGTCGRTFGAEHSATPDDIRASAETLTPGAFIRHPQQPDWGLGQVQSIIGHRATVGFEHRGKVLIDLRVVHLEPVAPDRRQPGPPAA